MAENVNAEVQLTAIPAAAATTPIARDPVKLIGTLSLLLIAFVFAFPVVWAALTSLKSTASVIATRYPLSVWSFFPPEPTLENYVALFTEMNFGRHLFNTALASGGQVILVVITSTLAGYAFARLRFPGREVLFALTLLTAFIPLEVILVPLYQVVSGMGLTSTYPALFLPFAAQPFGIYLMRQSFMQIPTELDDAARVDGAGTWRIFWRIAMPNVKPALATLVLIQFIWSWNAYLWPLVIMQDPNKQIVQVMLAGLKGSPNYSLDGPLFAGLTFVTVPLIVMAIVLQRHYVRGLMTSGIR